MVLGTKVPDQLKTANDLVLGTISNTTFDVMNNILLLCLFPGAGAQEPKLITELPDKEVVGIALGPNPDVPNAYMHMAGKLFIKISIDFSEISSMTWEVNIPRIF